MPLKKSTSRSKKAIQNAVSYNIAELTRANKNKPINKKRSPEQIAAISYSVAGSKKKK